MAKKLLPLLLVSATSLAAALPSPTAPESQGPQLLPFITWEQSTKQCGIYTDVQSCGTEAYCFMMANGYNYTAQQECLAKYEPNPNPPRPEFVIARPDPNAKLPFVTWEQSTKQCGIYTDARSCGTEAHCFIKANGQNYTAQQECLAKFEPNPNPPRPEFIIKTQPDPVPTILPWVSREDAIGACPAWKDARHCGTEVLCRDWIGRGDSQRERECLAHFEPNPDAAPAPSSTATATAAQASQVQNSDFVFPQD